MTASAGRGWALVTGASGGLGEEMAKQLAARGFPLVLVARSVRLLESLQQEIQASHGTDVRVLPMDLGLPGAGATLADEVDSMGLPVEVLVNNAGFGQWGPWVEQEPVEELSMIRLNVETPTLLTRRFVPGMVDQGRGRVLNVASTAAFFPGPLMAVYYATKGYLLSFSEALHEELRGTGVTVTSLCPGPVPTGFQTRASMHHFRLPSVAVVDGAAVARQGVEGMFRGAPLVVPGLANKLAVLASRFLPRRVVPKLVKAMQEGRSPRGSA